MARYNADGSLDTSFGTDGKLFSNFGGDAEARSVAIQSDGKIIVAGSYIDSSDNAYFVVARYNSNGSLDTSFGSGGRMITNHGDGSYGTAMILQPDGKIVVAGQTWAGVPAHDHWVFALVRYNSNGSLDTSFGSGGKVVSDFGRGELPFAVVRQPDGKIVVAGESWNSSYTSDFLMIRYRSNGSIDTSFGTNGRVTTNFGADESGNGIALQPDGKIVVAGKTEIEYGDIDFAIARYLNDQLGPNLIIQKTLQVDKLPINPGDPLTYTIRLTNDSSYDAIGVTITDTLPPYIEGTDLNTSVSIDAGEALDFTLSVTLSDSVPLEQTITNVAYVSHPTKHGQASATFTVGVIRYNYLPAVLK